MSDPLRTDTTSSPIAVSDPERDIKIEQLLLRGLDQYFAAEYEQAINIWTRVLFLDRSHARARAYIERARSALAERQRESEELLQNGVAAFNRGEGDEARRLLDAALRHGAPPEEALAVIDRLNRLEHSTPAHIAAPAPDPGRSRVMPSVAIPLPGSRFGVVGWMTVTLAIGACAFLYSASDLSWPTMLVFQAPPAAPPPVPSVADALPIPRRGEMALARARALAASGRLHDSIAALDQVHSTDPQKADADRLRSDIQRQLIGLASGAPPVQIENPAEDLNRAQ